MKHPVKILENAPKPPKRTGRRNRWSLPLAKLGPDDVLLIEMDEEEAQESVVSIRQHVLREQKVLGRKFSVYLCDEGVKIWERTEPEGVDG